MASRGGVGVDLSRWISSRMEAERQALPIQPIRFVEGGEFQS